MTRIERKLSLTWAHVEPNVQIARGGGVLVRDTELNPGAVWQLWPGPGGGHAKVARYLHAQDRQVRKGVQVLKFSDLVFPQK